MSFIWSLKIRSKELRIKGKEKKKRERVKKHDMNNRLIMGTPFQ